MNINFNPSLGTDLKYDDLDDGDIFISIDRDCADMLPALLMKVADHTDENNPKYYVLDLETGELYSDVQMYPIDKVITQEFTVDF